jgi:PAS domain S-box-containing protein
MFVLLSTAVVAAVAGYWYAVRRASRRMARRERVLSEWEGKFKALLAAASDAVFLFDAETTRVLDCNGRAEELIGLPATQLIGLHHADLYPEAETEMAREVFAAAVGAGGGARDLQVWHRSGYAIPVDASFSVIAGVARKYALGVLRNVSTGKELETVLRRERHLTDSIVETVNALVMVLDREGRIIRFNNACEFVSGYSTDEVRGRCIWGMFVADRDKKRVRDLFSAVLAGQFPIHYENVWRTRQGLECSIAWSNNAILDERGAVQYVIATGIDVTARKATEAALRRAHDEMEKRVVLRTAALRSANDALVQSEARLAEAQRIARMGNWEREVTTGRLLWSDEVFHIFGLEPGASVPTLAELLAAVHPEDRTRVSATLEQAVRQGVPFSHDYRILRPDGSERVVHDQGVVNCDAEGQAVSMVGTTQDITERKAVEEALRRAHDELEERVEARTAELRLANQALGFTQFAMDHAVDAVFWVDDAARFVYVNDAACRLLGYERPELLGSSWDKFCLTAEDGWGRDLSFAQEAMIFESLMRTRGGDALPVEITASHLFFDGVEYTCFFARDIRERRRAEVSRLAQLQAARTLSTISSRFVSGDDIDVAVSEALTDLRALLDARCAWLMRVDRSSPAAVEWLTACANAPDVERFSAYIEALRRGEVRVIYDDSPDEGGTATVLVPLFAEQVMIGAVGFEQAREAERWREGDFPVLRVAARVMTAGIQRHRAELQTMRLLEENRALARQSLEIQESERAHLARELHDELGQCLTAIRADAQSICRLTQDKEPRVYASGKAINDVAGRVYEVVRNIMRRLRPEMLDQLGLGAALRDVVNQWRNRQPEMEWVLEVSEPLGSLPEATQITAFRVVQECITNVIKHAGATRVEITALRSPNGLEVVVRDNGHGSNPNKKGGLGLLGMRERVLAAGGSFEMTNKPGHGYCIRALFPANEGEEMRNAS